MRSSSILLSTAFFVTSLVIVPISATAQDSHYWNNQFGTRSSLMGGAVVGGVRDTSASYYNPGALGFIENPSLSVTANAYKYDNVSIDSGVGSDDLDSSEINVIPLLLSGVFKFDGAPEHTLGYSVLTRNRSTEKVSARRDDVANVLTNPFAPGLEDFIGQYTYESSLTEVWGGLGYAYKADENISVGFTNFLAYRNQRSQEVALARAINQAVPLIAGTSEALTNYDYTTLDLLWKLGIAADYKPVRFGVAVTTPRTNIYSDGTSGRDITVTNLDFLGIGTPASFVADDRQEGLDAEFKSPLSVAGGIEVDADEDTKIGVSVEWFDSIDQYSVLSPQDRDFLRPTGVFDLNSKDFLRVSHAADSVVNYGVGLEHKFSNTFTGIMSFRTDKSSYETFVTDGSILGNSIWDIYHVTVGGIWKGEHSDFSAGIVYSFGDKNAFTQPVNFTNPTEGNFLAGTSSTTNADYDSIGIIVGYTYYLS